MNVLCFGEIIWDINKNSTTLGGAPLNVAGHLSQLGADAVILSAVGKDHFGSEAMQKAEYLGINCSYIHVLNSVQTGKAFIELKDGIPSYSFNEPAAWDGIAVTSQELTELKTMSFDTVVFGTLAQRNEVSRSTLRLLFRELKAKNWFFDVNLRLDFYDNEIIIEGLKRADILKMNDEEIPVIFELSGCSSYAELSEVYGIDTILVTKGKQGAECYEKGEVIQQGVAKVKVVDSIGAGDSLSAAFLFFKNKGLKLSVVLSRASMLADYVVSQKGAIPFYTNELKSQLL